jgi:hypothetical protein
MGQVCKVAMEEEEVTFPIEVLKEEKEERGYLVGSWTNTLITLNKVPSNVGIAEAYARMTDRVHSDWKHFDGLSPEWKSFTFTGKNFLDWVLIYDGEGLTGTLTVKIEVPEEMLYTVDDSVEGIESEEVKRFCKEHGLEETIYNYTDIVCDVFKNATRITVSLTSDPEIENREKIKLNISFKSDSDIETILKLDKELFKSISNAIPSKENDYFVKVYDIVE